MLTFDFDRTQIDRILPKEFQRQVPFIISKSINDVLFAAREDQIGDPRSTMGGQIDKYIKGGATRFTKRGMLVARARKTKLQGSIYFAANRSYMANTVYGGVVKPAKRRIITPSPSMLSGEAPGNALTKYGGVKRNTLKKQGLKSYFVGGVGRGRGSYGLWQRYGPKSDSKLRMVLDLNKTRRVAEVTYPADKLIKRFVRENIQHTVAKAVDFAIKTAR